MDSPKLPKLDRYNFRRRVLEAAQRRFHFRLHRCTGAAGCRRFTLLHRRLRRDGVFLHEQWLCCPGCLRAALARALSAPARSGLHAMPRLPRMPFRLILLQRRALTEQQLADALVRSEQAGISLARTLLDLALVTPMVLAQALAAENGCAAYTLHPANLPARLELPRALADESEAAAVHATASRLLIGFVSRIDREVLRAAEIITGLRAEPCFITAEHRARQIALSTQPPPCFGPPMAALEAAASLTRDSISAGAERVLLARVRDTVWARFTEADGSCRDQLLRVPASAAGSESARIPARDEKKLRAL